MTILAYAARSKRDEVLRARLAAAGSHVGALVPAVAAALARDGRSMPEPRPGDPLLLAATESAGSLWRLARPGDTVTCELGEQARTAWRIAARVAARTLPIAGNPAVLTEAPAPRLAPLTHPSDVLAVNGPSVGLAFALAHLSRAAGVPLAADLACSAEIAPDGTLKPVDRLDRKLEALRNWAPGVRRVLVATGQPLPTAPDGIELIPVPDLGAAWALAFDAHDFDAALTTSWRRDPAAAVAAARGFYRFALGEPASAVRWAAVARATALLAPLLTGEDRWRAEVAHAIVARHAGEPLALPPLPEGMRPRRPHRLQLLSQRLQAATDLADPAWPALAEEAEAELARPHEEHPEDLKVLGALGRLHSAWGNWAAAIPALGRAVRGWLELDHEPEASRPLCELLRIAGLVADAALADEAEAYARRCAADPRTSDYTRGFLQLEIGRARALLGDLDAARTALSDGATPWTEAALHTRASRLRWQARLPGGEGAFDALGALALADESCRFAWILARADRGEAAALDELDADDRRLWERILTCTPAASLARRLDLFPY